MKRTLSDIFIPLPNKCTYLPGELHTLNLQPEFISDISRQFNISYIENLPIEGNLCFAENSEVCPEYRTTFAKEDVVKYVVAQLDGKVVNIEEDEVKFIDSLFI